MIDILLNFFTSYRHQGPENIWVVITGIKDADPITQYVRSLYWAIVTMTTVGYGDITPHRNIEYVLTIVVMLIGASTYAFIIGNIVSLFSNLDAARAGFLIKSTLLINTSAQKAEKISSLIMDGITL